MEANLYNVNEEHIQLKQKLQTILVTLIQENQHIQEFYTTKISQLYQEISTKDFKISSLEEQLKFFNKKQFNLLRQLSEKQTIISKLNKTIQGLQRKFKQSIHNYIQKLDFSFNETYSKTNQKELPEYKRINISQYFIKTAERSREVTRCDQDISSQSSTFSSLYPSKNMNFYMPKKKNQPLITKVKSMDQQKFSQYVSCFMQNESKELSPTRRSPVHKRGKNSIVQELLKTPKSSKWRNLSGVPDSYRRGHFKNFYN